MQRGTAGKLKAAAVAFFAHPDLTTAKANPFTAAFAAAAETEVVSVWPENWPAMTLFIDLQTQWLIGMSGRTGLNYVAAYPLLDRLTTTDAEWWELFSDLQTMELAVLNAQGDANG